VEESLTKSNERLKATAIDVLARAQKGDRAAVTELQRLIETAPDLWTDLGDLARQARLAWLDLIGAGVSPLSNATTQAMTALHLDIVGPAPTTLERLLADRIVLCWLQVHYADIVCARAQDGRLQQREYYQRCQERAQRRYLAAIRSLACVRRLLRPGVQVNIAARQVNVA
jgi:hypothetical protein